MPARRLLCVVAVVALVPAAGAAGHSLGAAQSGEAPTREALAQVKRPPGARGRTLGLSRVAIPAHTALAPHRHPGDQIAYIEHGTLTYTVRTGVVRVYRGAADVSPRLVATIRAGETGRVRAGEWVVERQGDVHFGANRGRKPVVILLATLFITGSPPSIPVTVCASGSRAPHAEPPATERSAVSSRGQARACRSLSTGSGTRPRTSSTSPASGAGTRGTRG